VDGDKKGLEGRVEGEEDGEKKEEASMSVNTGTLSFIDPLFLH
jgi:hypothetical protein